MARLAWEGAMPRDTSEDSSAKNSIHSRSMVLMRFFLRSASTDIIVGATSGSAAASWFSYTTVAAESAVRTESSSESTSFTMCTL